MTTTTITTRTTPHRWLLAGLALAATTLAGCAGGPATQDTDPSPSPTTAPAATSTPATDTATPAPATGTPTPGGAAERAQLEIRTQVDHPPDFEFPAVFEGTFDVVAGAEALGCESGTSNDNWGGVIEKVLTCEQGANEGTFTITITPNDVGPWRITGSTGDFVGVAGDGSTTPTETDNGSSEVLQGEVGFGAPAFAVPATTVPRLVQGPLGCPEGLVSADGLREFAVVDGVLQRLDLETGDVTDLGPSPDDCVFWFADEEADRKVAHTFPKQSSPTADAPETTVFLGPYEGPFDTEIELPRDTFLLSRSFAGDRLVFNDTSSGELLLLDTTTGDVVGEPLPVSASGGRTSLGVATSPDGKLVALGAPDPQDGSSGRAYVLDAETGDSLAEIETPSPITTMAFDPSTDELVVALFDGGVLTFEVASGELVGETSLATPQTIVAVGVRPDGLLVVHTGETAVLVDRRDGPQGEPVLLGVPGAARVRPDGGLLHIADTQRFEVFPLDG